MKVNFKAIYIKEKEHWQQFKVYIPETLEMDYRTDTDNLNGLMDPFIEEIIIMDKDKVMDSFIMLKTQV